MNWAKKYQGILIIAAVILLFIGYKIYPYVFTNQQRQIEAPMYDTEKLQIKEGEMKEEQEEKTNETVVVDVKGAVKRPGVYEALQGDRVVDIIKKAGGIKDQGEENGINLALKITDEMVIYVPYKGEEGVEGSTESFVNTGGVTENESSNGEAVDLNQATAAELDELPGIGPAKAETIIEYRESNGGFSSKEDFKKISGIGEKTYEKLENLITVN
ncbi:helix-hairpin-helix domain-containing protein [Niallia nealsonii]|uniref:ComEA protein n=1 Tax=Niallia nealsonii TaxID=115979 RepID=A0A2N0Z4S5_9BACI|nr:helix-hairpin-helix domain-containing protein [Niallia nealsonii]PKG24498.1 comEA protein [Niallia nealsonii]